MTIDSSFGWRAENRDDLSCFNEREADGLVVWDSGQGPLRGLWVAMMDSGRTPASWSFGVKKLGPCLCFAVLV